VATVSDPSGSGRRSRRPGRPAKALDRVVGQHLDGVEDQRLGACSTAFANSGTSDTITYGLIIQYSLVDFVRLFLC
jgi:hypothetical protein